MQFEIKTKCGAKTEIVKISTDPAERAHVRVNQKSGEYEVTTSPMPSKGGCLRKCLAFLKDWHWMLVPAVRFVWENFPRLVLIAWSLFG